MSFLYSRKLPQLVLGYILFFAFGPGIIGFNLYNAYWGMRAESWPSTKGIVTSSRVEKSFMENRNGGSFYNAVVTYDYIVDGRTYSNDRVRYGKVSTSLQDAREKESVYHKGAVVAVHYSPDNHSRSVLETGLNNFTYVYVLFGCFAMLVGAIGIRRSRSSQEV